MKKEKVFPLVFMNPLIYICLCISSCYSGFPTCVYTRTDWIDGLSRSCSLRRRERKAGNCCCSHLPAYIYFFSLSLSPFSSVLAFMVDSLSPEMPHSARRRWRVILHQMDIVFSLPSPLLKRENSFYLFAFLLETASLFFSH